MARRRGKRREGTPGSRQREVPAPVATVSLKPRSVLLSRPRRTRSRPLIDDRRLLASRLGPPLRQDLSPSRVVVVEEPKARRPRTRAVSPFLMFKNRNVMVCVRRRERREVLHAKDAIGKGKAVSRQRRRKEDSDVRCK